VEVVTTEELAARPTISLAVVPFSKVALRVAQIVLKHARPFSLRFGNGETA
jgi:hypothetical protein